MKDHPGWKRGGTVLREGTKLFLIDNGSHTGYDWLFGTVNAIGEHYYIIPKTTDFYSKPLTKERTNMIPRNWIVVSEKNGPNGRPMKHSSKETAIDEAKRLVLQNPSDRFFVYELCKAFQVDAVKEIEVGDIPF